MSYCFLLCNFSLLSSTPSKKYQMTINQLFDIFLFFPRKDTETFCLKINEDIVLLHRR